MSQETEYRFDLGPLGLDEIRRLVHGMRSDIEIDDTAAERLRLDGGVLDGLRLRGPCPYWNDKLDEPIIQVRADDSALIGSFLDLRRQHFVEDFGLGNLPA